MNIQGANWVKMYKGSKCSSVNPEVLCKTNQRHQTPHNSPCWQNNPSAVKTFPIRNWSMQMAGLSILMAQELDHVWLIKKGVKLNPKTNPNPNRTNLQSFFTYHFRNFPALHKKQTLIHLLGSFTVVGCCLTKQEPSYNLKRGSFHF